ncbi:MAG: hypothetical protein M0Z80_14750 [Treponema sp.]|nr:hypothetical protein [Treponema sp.]
MKLLRNAVIVLAAAFVLASCSSMASGAVSGALGAVTGGAASGGPVAGAAGAVVEFQSGEVLASTSTRSEMDASFRVAKVIQPATVATKNQAEVVFIEGGSKSWVNYVVNSRKATKADMVVGATMFYLSGWQNHDQISADAYRKDNWSLGTITSVQDLYKNYVEISGNSFKIDYLRVPTDPIQ